MPRPMTVHTEHGPVQATWVDEYRYSTAAPCIVHNQHSPHSHVNEIHHVWPKGEGGPDIPENRIVVCATGHNSIHQLLNQFKAHKGDVPYAVLRTYSFGERKYARLGYDRIARQAM